MLYSAIFHSLQPLSLHSPHAAFLTGAGHLNEADHKGPQCPQLSPRSVGLPVGKLSALRKGEKQAPTPHPNEASASQRHDNGLVGERSDCSCLSSASFQRLRRKNPDKKREEFGKMLHWGAGN